MNSDRPKVISTPSLAVGDDSALPLADDGAGAAIPTVVMTPEGGPVSNTQRVYHELRRLIIDGEIEPARKLKIDDLRQRLDAGASPIREALSLLTSDQLVERIDQRGFRTASVSQAHFIEILTLRCQLEGIALRASIEHGDSQWQRELLAATEQLAAADRAKLIEWEALHKHFHHQLISACQSPILLRFCSQLYDLNIRYRNLATKAVEYAQRKVNAEHQSIVDAALMGDGDLASELLNEHYTRTGNYLAGLLTDMELS